MSISPQGASNQPHPAGVPFTKEEFQQAADEIAEAAVNVSLCVGAFAKYKYEYFPTSEIAHLLVGAINQLQGVAYLINVKILPYAPPDDDDEPNELDATPLVPGPLFPSNVYEGGGR